MGFGGSDYDDRVTLGDLSDGGVDDDDHGGCTGVRGDLDGSGVGGSGGDEMWWRW